MKRLLSALAFALPAFAAHAEVTAPANQFSDMVTPTYQSCGGSYPYGMSCNAPVYLDQPYSMNDAAAILQNMGCSLAVSNPTTGIFVCSSGSIFLVYGYTDGWAHTIIQI